MNKIIPKIEARVDDVNNGKFIVEPLDQGFGYTLGNALRRVLLSSIVGAAVTSISIEGVQHEFQTISGVKEDVTDFMLNLRELYVQMDSNVNFAEITIDIKGKGEVTGDSIECPEGVRVVNKNVYLAYITDENARLKVKMTVEKGKGYVLPDKQLNVKKSIGVIPMASVFSPVTKVSYSVDPHRVGQNTNFESLVIDIDTNGTIKAGEALIESCKVLISQFTMIGSYAGDIGAVITTSEADVKSGFDINLETLEFSHRTANCLRKENIQTVAQLCEYSESELMRIKAFGKVSLDEVNLKLVELGFELKADESSRRNKAILNDEFDEVEN